MSADSYFICPVCFGHSEKYRKGVDHLYGKVPQDEYETAKSEFIKEGLNGTMSAYHELTTGTDGKLLWNLFAKCDMCGAEWKFNAKISPKTEEAK